MARWEEKKKKHRKKEVGPEKNQENGRGKLLSVLMGDIGKKNSPGREKQEAAFPG